jgi:hypothetical protein
MQAITERISADPAPSGQIEGAIRFARKGNI